MGDFQIICVDKETSHGHILDVGISGQSRTYTVAEIYYALDQQDTFHTGSRATGDYAVVAKFNCTYCGRPTLRSHSDRTSANNLDNLRSCR
jgi:hypothetical protein